MAKTTSAARPRVAATGPRATGSTTARTPTRPGIAATRAPVATAAKAAGGATAEEVVSPVNEVRLRGRLAAPSQEIPMPSGDVAATFRLVVDRAPSRRRAPRGARVDSIECTTFSADLRRKVARFDQGDVVEVAGVLQRQFFRSGGAAASRYNVVVDSLSRVARVAATHRATMTG